MWREPDATLRVSVDTRELSEWDGDLDRLGVAVGLVAQRMLRPEGGWLVVVSAVSQMMQAFDPANRPGPILTYDCLYERQRIPEEA